MNRLKQCDYRMDAKEPEQFYYNVMDGSETQ